MSNTSSVFNSVPVKVPSRSGFDLSHEVISTFPGAGTLVPLACIPTLPGDRFSIGSMHQVSLPPAVADYYGRVDVRLEAFFVANQCVWAGWNRFISRDKNHNQSVPTPGWTIPSKVPTFSFYDKSSTVTSGKMGDSSYFGKGTLLDYLGFYAPNADATSVTGGYGGNVLPLLAYHKIIDDFYIDKNLQVPFFSEGIPNGLSINNSTGGSTTDKAAAFMPSFRDTQHFTADGANISSGTNSNVKACRGINGTYLWELRQRNWAKDLFTTCSAYPQQNSVEAAVQINIPSVAVVSNATSATSTSFTIRQLRVANACERWLERNNIAGFDPSDAQLAHWGVRPSYCMQDKAILLGATSSSVVCRSTAVTNAGAGAGTSTNGFAGGLFGTGGDTCGKGGSFGKDSLVDNFECHDYGYIIILGSLVPHRVYNNYVDNAVFGSIETLDYPFPEFAAIGDQPIYQNEVATGLSATNARLESTGYKSNVFGYNQQYSRYKFLRDRVCGDFHSDSQGSYVPGATGGSLSHMVLADPQLASSQIGSSFIEIPADYLDQVLNTNNAVSGFAGYGDFYFSVKAMREIPIFTLPSL